jgi:hypothetical protein
MIPLKIVFEARDYLLTKITKIFLLVILFIIKIVIRIKMDHFLKSKKVKIILKMIIKGY